MIYHIRVTHLKEKHIVRIDSFLKKAGYRENVDYRFNYFSSKTELSIDNETLGQELKSILKIN